MPTFKVTDPQSGQVIRLTGDSPPTEQELEGIFSKLSQGVQNGPSTSVNNVSRSGVGGSLGELETPQELPSGGSIASIIEPAQTIVTGAIAEPIAGLAGIVGGLLPGEEGQGQRAIEATREALTFKPKTREGQAGLEAVGEALAPVAEAFTESEKALGDATFEATGSPALAAAASSLPTLATEVLGIAAPAAAIKTARATTKAVSKVSKPVVAAAKKKAKQAKITRELNEALPTIDQLKDTSRAVYEEIDSLGVTVKPESFKRLAISLRRNAQKEGLNPTLTPDTSAALKEFDNAIGRDINLTEIDTLRKIAQNAASSVKPADARLGSIMIESVDQFLDNINTGDFKKAFGTPKDVGKRYKTARELWGRARRSELIQEAFQKADLQASGFENGVRTQFRSILNNKKKRRFFKPDEVQAMNRVVKGDKKENLAKLVGRLGFSEGGATNILGGLGGVAAGGAIAGGPGALIVPVIGQLSRKLAQRMTAKNAEFADSVIRAGKDGRKIVEAYLDNTPKNDISSAELSELLMRPNIDLTNLPKGRIVEDARRIAFDRQRELQGAAVSGAVVGSETSQEETRLQQLLEEQESDIIQ